MPNASTFDRFRDDFLIFAASKQNGSSPMPIGVYWVAKSDFPNVPDAWRVEVVLLLERQGFGTSINTGMDQEFTINGEGLLEAGRIKSGRELIGRIRKYTADHWLKIYALAVSIFALFK